MLTLTIKDSFPLPLASSCFDALAGSKVFSTIDITSAYNQVPIKPSDVPKTAFCSKFGLFEYVKMPFGLCNAPATFQRLMECVLNGLQWTTCVIYLDDIIVHSVDFDSHVDRLAEVLERIQSSGLKLKARKCSLFRPEVTFLGHVVNGEGLKPNPDNVSKLVNWPRPQKVSEVRGLVGLGSYYRRFIKNYSQIVQPLVALTRKDVPFEWSDACEAAFENLKKALVSPPVMAYPTAEGEFVLDTDASDVSIGAVLSQIHAGEEKVIAYGSRTLNRAERNYCTTNKELLAIKHFVEYYKHYLLGRHFIVRTDHQALKWLFSMKEPRAMIARWIEVLSQYDFTIEYRKGTKHQNADSLSRCPNPRDCQCEDSGEISVVRNVRNVL